MVWPGVSRQEKLDAFADLDHVARGQPAVDAGDAVLRLRVRQKLGAGRRHHLRVAAGMVAVLVRVEDLRDGPAFGLRRGKAFLVVERIDRERLAGLGAGDEIVEVPAGIAGPDLFDEHHETLSHA